MLDEISSESLARLFTFLHVESTSSASHLFSTAKSSSFTSSLKRGDVIEIQGPPSSGKTHLLYHLLIHCIIPSAHHSTSLGGWGKAGIVFDMDHSFDIVRFNRLLLAHLTRLLGGGTSVLENVAKQSLERLRIFRPCSSLQLSVTISHLAEYHCEHLAHEEIGIAAIDSMSTHYWPDRFVAQQLRTGTASAEHIPPLQHVLLALESFRRTHSPLIVMTNWGLHSVTHSDPFLYRQHLHPFPAPFPHSYPATAHRGANTALPAFHENMLMLTCHITVHQDINGKSYSSETYNDSLDAARKGRIVGLVRTPNVPSVGRFLLHITNDDILAD